MNQVILEVVQHMWTTESSNTPFSQPNGFYWQRNADGLYAWKISEIALEGDNEHRRAIFFMDAGRLQAMLKFIADTHPVQSEDEALRVLLAHLRSPQGQPGCGRYLFFLFLPFLGMACYLGVMLLKTTPYANFNAGLAFLLGFLIATPVVMIAYLLIFGKGRAQSKVVRKLTYQNPQQYLEALHAANGQLQAIESKPWRSVSWLPVALWALWLAAAVTATVLL